MKNSSRIIEGNISKAVLNDLLSCLNYDENFLKQMNVLIKHVDICCFGVTDSNIPHTWSAHFPDEDLRLDAQLSLGELKGLLCTLRDFVILFEQASRRYYEDDRSQFLAEHSIVIRGKGNLGKQIKRELEKVYFGKIEFTDEQDSGFDYSKKLVVCAVGGNQAKIKAEIEELGGRCINTLQFYAMFPDFYYKEGFIFKTPQLSTLLYLLLKIKDKESIEILRARLEYQFLGNYMELLKFARPVEEQWVEGLKYLSARKLSGVVVGGVYDGNSTKAILEKLDSVEKVYGFEIDSKNIEIAKKNLKYIPHVELLEIGLGERPEEGLFNLQGGTNNSVINTSIDLGHYKLGKVSSIDASISNKVDLIKLDIEGSEIPAILGAVAHIRRSKPLLEIAVYHKFGDLWEIPLLVERIRKDYVYVLRHYTDTPFETILYCY